MNHRPPLAVTLSLKTTLATLLVVSSVAACGRPATTPVAQTQASPTAAPEPTPTAAPSPTHTAAPTATWTPTSTPPPTHTPTPEPSPTPSPTQTTTPSPTSTPALAEIAAQPDTVTVCADGCDFTSIQAAIDDPGTPAGYVIYVTDAVHTEAGIVVDKELTIRGRGPEQTIVQAHEKAGAARDRVFFIPQGATVSIQEMTIRHGNPREGIRSGGGIENRGTLTLARCVVRDNQANCGGGVYNEGGTLTVSHCTMRDNVADGQGPVGYACGSGGAIKVTEGGVLTLSNSTLSGNHAEGKGGGLHVSCESAAILSNCTISGNRAVGRGGGINIGGTATLTHCTIIGNSAKGIVRGKPVEGKAGGGVSVRGTLHYANTLIAHNPKDGDCVVGGSGVIGTNAYNLVEDRGCQAAYSGDPLLDDLADNGGDTQTRALLPGSPAVDVIPAAECPIDVDQRGQARPVAQTSPDTPCDVGAFELQ